jgi:hypothetical protein
LKTASKALKNWAESILRLFQQNRPLTASIADGRRGSFVGQSSRAFREVARQLLTDSVEKVPSLKSLQICQNTIDIFD